MRITIVVCRKVVKTLAQNIIFCAQGSHNLSAHDDKAGAKKLTPTVIFFAGLVRQNVSMNIIPTCLPTLPSLTVGNNTFSHL